MTAATSSLDATDFVVITCKVQIQTSKDEVWALIGGFTDAGRFLNVPCEIVSATAGIGSVRSVNHSIFEVMVGQTAHSYSYAQITGPMAHLAYHGCLSLAPADNNSCIFTYTITYDQTLLEDSLRQDQNHGIRTRFQQLVDAVKLEAEQDRAPLGC